MNTFPPLSDLKLLTSKQEARRSASVVFIRNFTIEPLDIYLKYLGSLDGLSIKSYFSTYSGLISLNRDSEIYNTIGSCELVYYFFSIDVALREFPFILYKDSFSLEEVVSSVIQEISTNLRNIRSATQSPIALFINKTSALNHSYHPMPGRLSCDPFNEIFNGIEKLISGKQHIYIEDLNTPIYELGNRNAVTPEKLFTKLSLYSLAGLEILVNKCYKYVRMALSEYKKVLVLDCDNTLWGGIVGESTIDELRLGKSYIGTQFQYCQAFYKFLSNSGVVLCICSKNDADIVENVFSSHPHMKLAKSDVVLWRVNWEDKASNIVSISESLNLTLDSFVFVDDSVHELDAVKTFLPQVTCIQCPPQEPTKVISSIIDASLFNLESPRQPNSFNRTQSYHSDERRSKLKAQQLTTDEYIKSLDINLIVSSNAKAHTERLLELTNRTNQFNLTNAKFTLFEMQQSIDNPSHFHYLMSANDRFGDLGIISYMQLLPYDSESIELAVMVMSCRAFGRKMEHSFFLEVVYCLRSLGFKSLNAPFKPTNKNTIARIFCEEIGLTCKRKYDDGINLYNGSLESLAGYGRLNLHNVTIERQ